MPARIPRAIFEVTLASRTSAVGDVELLKGLLTGVGIREDNIVECREWPQTCLAVYFNSRTKARGLQERLRAFRLKYVSVRINTLHDRDWRTKWKREFRPFSLTPTFTVVPMWLKDRHRLRGRTPIYIDTGVAFGTGLHATTRFMAQFIERCRGRFTRFLDLGTGTGILAIMAAKCGAQDVTAVDISPEAVDTAKANCAANACAGIKIQKADAARYRAARGYDLVCANIITQDLIRMSDKIVRLVKPGKYLAVSGISLKGYAAFRAAYARCPLRCLKIEKGEGWVGLLYKKQE